MYSELEGIGLTKGEIAVYTTLLKMGETTTGKIIDEAGISSGKIYEILEKLAKKGLVGYITKERTKYFSARAPNKLLDYVKIKEQELKQKEEAVKKLLPKLVAFQSKKPIEFSTMVYKGIEGFRTALHEILAEMDLDDEWLGFGVTLMREAKLARFWHEWHKGRVAKKIPCRLIVSDSDYLQLIDSNYFREYKIFECRYLSRTTPVSVAVTKKVIMMYEWESLHFLVIKNKNVAKSFRTFFDDSWKLAKPLKL